ncbi:hypothetical protein [uncultured Jatrophihabitans sp.]|uniref:hypothetical protein n=1 Tax=uncultured Jatrophihabitans sp. TaxID=1610747 RepID=UPI0035CB6404
MSSTVALPGTTFAAVRTLGRRRSSSPSLPLIDTAALTRDLAAIRALPDWLFVERSPFGFVDQVAVAPSAIIAITARYHVALSGDAHVQRAWKAIRDAKGTAALMKQMLGPDAPEVTPVLVLSGPGAPELADGHMLIKGVRVVDAQRPELWSHLFTTPVLSPLERRRLAKSLQL